MREIIEAIIITVDHDRFYYKNFEANYKVILNFLKYLIYDKNIKENIILNDLYLYFLYNNPENKEELIIYLENTLQSKKAKKILFHLDIAKKDIFL